MQYSSTTDYVEDLEIQREAMVRSLRPQQEVVEKLGAEWEECMRLDKIEDKIVDNKIYAAWSLVNEQEDKDRSIAQRRDKLRSEHAKLQGKVEQHESNPPR